MSEIQGTDLHRVGGYPPEIADFDPKDFGLSLNNCVWDIEWGNILKLAEGKLVVRAYHGKTILTRDQIETQYGSPPEFRALNFPTVIRSMEKS